jgi:hypothetical protein
MHFDGLEPRVIHPSGDLLVCEPQPHVVERVHHPGLLVLHEVRHHDLATGTKDSGALHEDPGRVRCMVDEEAKEHGIEGTIFEGEGPTFELDVIDLLPSAQHLLAPADVTWVEIQGCYVVTSNCQGAECIAVLTTNKEDIDALDQVHKVVRNLLIVVDTHQSVKVMDEPCMLRGGFFLLLGAFRSFNNLLGPIDLLRFPLDFGVDRFLFLVRRVYVLLLVYQNTSDTLFISMARLTSMVIRRPVLMGFLQREFPYGWPTLMWTFVPPPTRGATS